MLPAFVVPETVARQDGAGAEVVLGTTTTPVRFTLGITQSLAQESLDVSIWGSSDRRQWTELASFPQKFYCGTYSMVLDLERHPSVRYVRAQWKMGLWGNRPEAPLFGFYVRADEGRLHQYAGAA